MSARGRYELKFVVSAAERSALLEATRGLLRPDPHGGEAARYRVTSQYFDSPDLRAVRSKIDGVSRRAKVRVRFYGEVDPAAPQPLSGRAGFVEVKRRRKDQVFKERAALAPAGLVALLEDPRLVGDVAPWLAPGTSSDPITGRLARMDAAVGLAPSCVITYQREALLGVEDPDVRLSLDSDVRAFDAAGWGSVSGAGGVSLLAGGALILELKFAERIPRWLRDHVARLGLRVRRFSKYATGVVALRAR